VIRDWFACSFVLPKETPLVLFLPRSIGKLDGQNTSIPSHIVDHALTGVGGAGTGKLEDEHGIVTLLLLERQPVLEMVAKKRAQEVTLLRIWHIRSKLDKQSQIAGSR
jgi:hypothetical protein